MNLKLSITKDESAQLMKLASLGKRLLDPLAKAWGSGAQEVLGRAVRGRFTGKGPFPVSQNRLGVVTNRLRKSMRATLPLVNEATGSISLTMGSNVEYYAAHEFGFRGRVQVPGHTRRTLPAARTFRGKLTAGSQKAITDKMRARELDGTRRGRATNATYVRPHTRRVNTPARAPLGTELNSIQTRLTFRQKITAVIRLLTARNS